MRLPEVAVASASHSSSSASPARNSSSVRLLRPSSGVLAPPSAADAGSGGWTLPPLNQFMTLPRRFMPSSFGASVDSSTVSSPSSSGTDTDNRNRNALGSTANGVAMGNLLNDEEEDWEADNHFVLPHMVHFQDVRDSNDAATGPVNQPEEIDLTVSSEEDEDGGQNAADNGDIIEILDSSGVPQPVPLPRKRRRPGANKLLEPKRQRMTDMMRSADSTNINLQNSEVVEEFKRRLKCSICLDVLEDMTSTLCGHIFCAGCIHQAIRTNGKCPLCQRRLHLKDTHRLFF
ncbi:hypothetical protein JG688_00001372 [Phytophthora aleatoria]|uniref:RING-type domain-containing protein n=1 Tax=Phytophthora aleatoria TaxID=2496075 RepID=A0A8J5JGT0_9STRA|nr:hypothetical protein JG688_00001372 [Phytophthora aleatoria]